MKKTTIIINRDTTIKELVKKIKMYENENYTVSNDIEIEIVYREKYSVPIGLKEFYDITDQIIEKCNKSNYSEKHVKYLIQREYEKRYGKKGFEFKEYIIDKRGAVLVFQSIE